jgi:hypothetical protein
MNERHLRSRAPRAFPRKHRRRISEISSREKGAGSYLKGPLHIQCDGSRDGGRFRELIAEVLSWTNVECIPSLANCLMPADQTALPRVRLRYQCRSTQYHS